MVGIAPQEAPTQADELEEDEGEAASPEEQQQYDEFVVAAMFLIYDEGEVKPNILKLLDEEPSDLMAVLGNVEQLKEFSPSVAIAATAAMIALQIVQLAGEEAPDGPIILHAGQEIVEQLAEISMKMGNEITEDDVNRAMSMAADLYREAAADAGLVDEEALKAEFDEIATADREGRLGEVLPELDKVNKAAEQNAVEGEEE